MGRIASQFLPKKWKGKVHPRNPRIVVGCMKHSIDHNSLLRSVRIIGWDRRIHPKYARVSEVKMDGAINISEVSLSVSGCTEQVLHRGPKP